MRHRPSAECLQFNRGASTLPDSAVPGLRFEWDDAKDVENRRKHGFGFEDAKAAFADVFARVVADPDSQGEERFVLLGMNASQLLVVCYCEAEPDLIRIISARKASRRERAEYEGFRHA